jgi:hypothetical protein
VVDHSLIELNPPERQRVLCARRRLSLTLALLRQLSFPRPELSYMLHDLSKLFRYALFTYVALTQVLVVVIGRVVMLFNQVVDHKVVDFTDQFVD